MHDKIKSIILASLLFASPLVINCDTVIKKDPYMIITVGFTPPFAPALSDTNKLFAIFYVDAFRLTPWMTLTSTTNQFIVPRLNIGSTPIYFEVVYDADGNGVDSGDNYKGWYNVDSSTALTPLVLPETDMVMLTIALDNATTL